MAFRSTIAHQRRRRIRASSLATAVIKAGVLVVTAQTIQVAWSTPRLPPPPKSGHDFDDNGLLVRYHHQDDDDEKEKPDDEDEKKQDVEERREFNIVFIGDSPIEGIGNDRHLDAISGQTALAFSRLLNGRYVRYWAYGVSGLTAQGIETQMIPHLQRIASTRKKIDVVVISCGVNNVLWGQSASTFENEVRSLIRSVRQTTTRDEEEDDDSPSSIVLLGLPDFARMPFLPWPLSAVTGWRGRALQGVMEKVVEEVRAEYVGGERVMLASLPEVEDVLGVSTLEEEEEGRRPHVLLDHLNVEKEMLSSLRIEDFFADDGFHPAKYGTTLVGTLIARVYAENVEIKGLQI